MIGFYGIDNMKEQREDGAIISIADIDSGVSIVTGKPIRKALFFESMTEVKCPNTGARVRIWRREPEVVEYADAELLALFKAIPEGVGVRELLDVISSVERVTAVEVVDSNGLGCVAYYEW